MQQTKHRTGLAIHGSTVALSTSRAATSHLRRHFRRRYRGRYRFARTIFVFDLALLAIGLGLLVLNVVLVTTPAETPIGLALTLRSRDLVSADVMPMEATVRAIDATTHSDVRLTWLLPPWVEVLRADPPLDANGSVVLGEIAPLHDARSRIYVRIRATTGMAVPFSFRLDEESGSGAHVFSGSESRQIASSAMQFESVLPSPTVASGATIPLRIRNAGSVAAPAVIVRLVRSDFAPQSTFGENGEVRIGTLSPGASQVVSLHVDPDARGTAIFDFEIQDASRAVTLAHLTVPIVDASSVMILDARPTTDGHAIDVTYRATNPGTIAAIATSRPSSTQDIFTVDVMPQESTVRISLPADGSTRGEWTIVPFEKRSGNSVIGYGKTVGIGMSLPFATRVRYFADGGDQIGVGPLPPKVGETTTYWVVMALGPTSSPLHDIVMTTMLGNGVRTTGRHASVVSGNVSSNNGIVTWAVPDVPTISAEPVTFAFEVSFTPQSFDRGHTPTLVTNTTVTALDAATGSSLFTTRGVLTTDLTQDPLAIGKGKVE